MTKWILSKLIAAAAGLVYYSHHANESVDRAAHFGRMFGRLILADSASEEPES